MENNETRDQERPAIKTNPVFQSIVLECWEKAGGDEQQGSLVLSCSCQELISEAIQKLFQISDLPENASINLWNKMKQTGLAKSQRDEIGQGWKLTLFNPNNFNWDLSEEPRYRWLKPKKEARPEPAEKSAEKSVAHKFPKPSADLSRDELDKAQNRLTEYRKNMDQLLQKEAEKIKASKKDRAQAMKNLETALKPYEEIVLDLKERIALWQKISELEEQKLQKLQLLEEPSLESLKERSGDSEAE